MIQHDPPLGRVIDRIQKLVALARGGGTEAEAEQAMKLVHALLAQHNLSLEKVLASRVGENRTDRVIETVEAANNPWERPIWHATASLYFCEFYFARCFDWSGRKLSTARINYSLVGKPHNILVARLMTDYFLTTIRRLARTEARGAPKISRRSFAHSFRVACAKRLSERIWERKRETQEHPTPLDPANRDSLLPVLTSFYGAEEEANRELLAERGIHLVHSARGRTHITDVLGEYAGKRAAETIGVDAQLASGNATNGGGRRIDDQMSLPLP
jgi:hypothetical protein